MKYMRHTLVFFPVLSTCQSQILKCSAITEPLWSVPHILFIFYF